MAGLGVTFVELPALSGGRRGHYLFDTVSDYCGDSADLCYWRRAVSFLDERVRQAQASAASPALSSGLTVPSWSIRQPASLRLKTSAITAPASPQPINVSKKLTTM